MILLPPISTLFPYTTLFRSNSSSGHVKPPFATRVVRFVPVLDSSESDRLSWGQAQKPLNVFLKVYVAWARLPEATVAERLDHFLHVPLDSVLMGFMKKEFPHEYRQHIVEGCAKLVAEVAAQPPDFAKDRIASLIVDSVELAENVYQRITQ